MKQTVEKISIGGLKVLNPEYLLYIPNNLSSEKDKLPLMLFLHGAGERGEDILKVKTHGPAKIVEESGEFGFVLLSPQCREKMRWDPAEIMLLLDEVISKYKIDTDRIYLTGLSMGGFGTWATAVAYPDKFAAIAPVCGGGDPSKVCVIKNLPVWAFHGAKDEVVPINRTEEMVNALKQCGGSPRFTVYPEAGHDSWTQTYNNPELYDWLLGHTKK